MMSDERRKRVIEYGIGRTRSDETIRVVELVRASFDESRARFLAFSQSGMARNLDVAVRHPSATPERTLLSARDPVGKVIGFADFRLLDDHTGFLSYIAVDEVARGSGVATALFKTFVEANPGVRRMKLDVFRDNVPANRLYDRMGFVFESSSAWITRHLPVARNIARFTGLPSALASYEAYGFCELDVTTEHQSAVIGLLGPTVLNARSLDVFQKDDILAGTRYVFPELSVAFASVPERDLTGIQIPHRLEGLSDRLSLAIPGRTQQGQEQ